MGANTYYLELIFILMNIFQPQKVMKEHMLTGALFLTTKDKETLEKKLDCKFITINTSKEGYNADYEVSRIQTFIGKFRERDN